MSGEPVESDLARQARSVAESILASPKHEPFDASQTKAPAPVNLEASPATSSYPGPPTSMMENLKISDDEPSKDRKEEEDEDEDDDGTDIDPSEFSALFIGDLARTVVEDQLRHVFESHGEVVMVDIKRDKVTHNNLGYGFVQFKTREEAVAAKKALHGTEIGGRKIRIGWAQKNTTLFVGDLDGKVTTEQLRSIFSAFGPLIVDETFVKAGNAKFGFVRFQHRIDAERAKAEMNRKVIGERPVRIGWGDNNVQKHCVHVQFNPAQGVHLQEAHFRKLFEPFGSVQNVSLPRFPNRRLKGYVFVHFQETDEGEKSAAQSIAALNESKVANVPIRCSYGKRQVFNRYNRRTGGGKFRAFPRPGELYAPAYLVPVNGQWIQYPGGQLAMSGQHMSNPPYYGPSQGRRDTNGSMYMPPYYAQQMYYGQNGYGNTMAGYGEGQSHSEHDSASESGSVPGSPHQTAVVAYHPNARHGHGMPLTYSSHPHAAEVHAYASHMMSPVVPQPYVAPQPQPQPHSPQVTSPQMGSDSHK